jgi:hypothetical protein
LIGGVVMYNRPYSDKLAAAAGQRKDEKEFWLNKLSGDLVKAISLLIFIKAVGAGTMLNPSR